MNTLPPAPTRPGTPWPARSLLLALCVLLSSCGDDYDVYKPVNEIEFASKVLTRCVREDAARNGWKTAGRVTAIHCTNPHGEQITDLSGIAQLVNLSSLNVSHNAIEDISPLTGLLLQNLDLGYNRIRHLEFHESTASLLSLICDHNQIDRLDWIKPLKNLRHLSLSANSLTDITLLGDRTALRSLNVARNRIDSIAPLAALTKLEVLDIGRNRIDDLAPLRDLHDLILLRADDNRIVDVEPLAGAVRLVELGLSNNRITDVAPLGALEQLEGLDLDGNELTDVSPLGNLPEVQRVSLRHNAALACGDVESLAETLPTATVLAAPSCGPLGD